MGVGQGLPLHLWTDEQFAEIGDTCGGIVDVNPRLGNLDLQWVNLKLHPCNPGQIPKVLELNNGESFFRW